MFSHAAGFRPLWPVLLFLPWLLVGAGWLVRALLPGEKAVHQPTPATKRMPPARR
jgi:hypothetical protein